MIEAYFHLAGISTFFDNDLTYFRIVQDVFILLSFIALTWDLQDVYFQKHDPSTPRRDHGVTKHTPILYALTFATRLSEYYPFDFLSYDLAACSGFATIYIITMYLHTCVGRRTEDSPSSRPSAVDICKGNDSPNLRLVYLHVTVGSTAILAYFINYGHLILTPGVYMWAWSHYLEAVAMVPQLFLLAEDSDRKYRHIWFAVTFTAVSRIFELVDWVYLFLSVDMLDPLAVASAVFYLGAYSICVFIHFIRKLMTRRSNGGLKVRGDKPEPLLSDVATSEKSQAKLPSEVEGK